MNEPISNATRVNCKELCLPHYVLRSGTEQILRIKTIYVGFS